MYSKTIIVGKLTADPELRQTPNGVSVTAFSVAVNRAYTPKGGERKSDFYEVVAWRSTAEFICRYFGKGNAILVEGNMESREYTDKHDVKRRVWELIAANVSFVESKASATGQGGGRDNSLPSEPPAYANGGNEDFTEIEDDGDLPF